MDYKKKQKTGVKNKKGCQIEKERVPKSMFGLGEKSNRLTLSLTPK